MYTEKQFIFGLKLWSKYTKRDLPELKKELTDYGDSVVLSWTTQNTDSSKRCAGIYYWNEARPFPNDSPYPPITQTNI